MMWSVVRFTPTYVGKIRGSGSAKRQGRFTPTYVGKIPPGKYKFSPSTVHPHIRGENASILLPSRTRIGSPPHTWGKWNRWTNWPTSKRFTPTYVGKISALLMYLWAISVHPHIRGENEVKDYHIWALDGSPPHTWGKLPSRQVSRVQSRFTPTYVGKMFFAKFIFNNVSVHPHIRGENASAYAYEIPVAGSPPHTWGKYRFETLGSPRLRFTPTYVGKIFGYPRKILKYSVHPHIRGENNSIILY